MTRGKFIYIGKDAKLVTIEFNGDMYPGGYANEIIDNFQKIHSAEDFSKFVEKFDRKNFRYENDLVKVYTNEELDFRSNITDYLYILNNTKGSIKITASNGEYEIPKRCLGIINYSKYYDLVEGKSGSMPISKSEFVRIIERLQATSKLTDNVNALFRSNREALNLEFQDASALYIAHEDIVVELLEKLTKDKSGDISYFIYELDFGKKYEPGCITEDDKNVDISTAQKLYDYLEENYDA